MINRLLPRGTLRGRSARALAQAVRCLHPVASKRSDPGDVIEALRGEYPYRYWLRAQRRRRDLPPGPNPSEAGFDCGGGPGDLFEPGAARLIAGALDGGAKAVVFHHDVAGRPDSVRIVSTPGPVSDFLRSQIHTTALCRPAGSDDTPIDWRDIRRIDELLLHRGKGDGRGGRGSQKGGQEAARARTARHDGGETPEPATPEPATPEPSTPEPSTEAIAVVVPSPASTTLLEQFFEGLRAEDRVAEVVVVDNSAPTAGADEFYRSWGRRLPLQVLRTDPEAPFNYSRANNLGARASVSPVLAFCNDDLEFVAHPTLARLAGWLSVRDVGVAGPQLRYPDGTIQHGGVVLGLNGLAEHAFTGMRPGSHTLIGSTDRPRDVSAVTGACLVTSRTVFEEVGGFDEELVLTGSDVWFCLRAADLGGHTAYDGTIVLVHHESVTRGHTNHVADVLASAERWGHLIDAGDPYWSQLLSVNHHEPTLRRRGDPTSREMLSDHLRRHGVADVSVRWSPWLFDS